MQYYLDTFGFLVCSPYIPKLINKIFRIEMKQIKRIDDSAIELKDLIVKMVNRIRFKSAMIEDIVKGKYNIAIPIQIKK